MRSAPITVFMLSLVSAASCSDSGGTSGAGGAPTDGGADAGCSQPGSAACDEVIGALCQRIIQCCSAVSCPTTYASVNECKGTYVAAGYNCAGEPFAGKSVCQDATTTCAGDVPLIACSDLTSGTANWPPSCNSFWAGFGLVTDGGSGDTCDEVTGQGCSECSPSAFQCTTSAECLSHKCNAAAGCCVWPCTKDGDCAPGNRCEPPACVPN